MLTGLHDTDQEFCRVGHISLSNPLRHCDGGVYSRRGMLLR